MGGSIPEVLPWDYFHLGLLLVLIMVLITGIVIFVAVIGVCCFHWLDTKEQVERRPSSSRRSRSHNSSKSPQEMRDHVVRLDNSMNEWMRRNEQATRDIPPPYEDLFPRSSTPIQQPHHSSSSSSSSPPVIIIADV